MILILSNKWDVTVDFVVQELHRRNSDFLRINTEDLWKQGLSVRLPNLQIAICKQGKHYDLTSSVKVIWLRRPGKTFDEFAENEKPSIAVQRFVNDQWYSCLEALQHIDRVTWINDPHANNKMESKIRQLRLASSIGLDIPQTLISNDPNEVSAFSSRHGPIIAKALYSPLIEEPEKDYFIFSTPVSESDLSNPDDIRISPTIFQALISPKTDYRVTVIGDIVIPVRITIPSNEDSGPIDWRARETSASFAICTIPRNIEALCKQLIRESGLLFGAIDFAEKDGIYYFLEINPNGEWGWLQKSANARIAEAMCDLMESHNGDSI